MGPECGQADRIWGVESTTQEDGAPRSRSHSSALQRTMIYLGLTEDPEAERAEAPEEAAAMRQAWRNSPERRRSRLMLGSSLGVSAFALVVFGFLARQADLRSLTELERNFLQVASLLIMVPVAFAPLSAGSARSAFNDRYLLEKAKRGLARADEAASDEATMTLGSLWLATQTRLDYYHDIATSQSRRSFVNGQLASGIGLVVILICAALAASAGSLAGAAAAGGLGAAGAALSGYIGSTFLKTQDTASAQLREYFGQPLDSSRFLSAERLLATIEDKERRENATVDVIRALVEGRTPTAPYGASNPPPS